MSGSFLRLDKGSNIRLKDADIQLAPHPLAKRAYEAWSELVPQIPRGEISLHCAGILAERIPLVVMKNASEKFEFLGGFIIADLVSEKKVLEIRGLNISNSPPEDIELFAWREVMLPLLNLLDMDGGLDSFHRSVRKSMPARISENLFDSKVTSRSVLQDFIGVTETKLRCRSWPVEKKLKEGESKDKPKDQSKEQSVEQ